MVRRNTLQAADGDGLSVQPAAAARRLTGTIASAPQDGREHVRLAIQHVGVGKTPLSDQADIFGDIRVGRTRPLAIDDFVVISGIFSIRAVQTSTSSCVSANVGCSTTDHCSDNVMVPARTLIEYRPRNLRRLWPGTRDARKHLKERLLSL
jgi:hypothetical protein